MKRSRLPIAAFVAAIATLLALVAAPSASAAREGQQSFLMLSNDIAARTYPVIAKGVVHAQGVDHVINNHRDRFVFRHGALLIRHHSTFHRAGPFDDVTCSGGFTERGVWRILSGTRRYSEASGLGTYVARGIFVGRLTRAGACLPNTPRLWQLTIRAKGTIRLP